MKVNLTIGIPAWLDKICAWPVMLYRKHKYGWPFRRIYLGDSEWTIVDADVYYRLGSFKWSSVSNDKDVYAARILRKTEYGRIKTIYLHREIMNAPAGLLVDHKNNNSLDNRRNNLRFATRCQNMWNRRKTKTKTSSRFSGVHFHKLELRWGVQIQYKGKKIWLGYYDSEIEAAHAYDRAAIKYHGEFARLNFAD